MNILEKKVKLLEEKVVRLEEISSRVNSFNEYQTSQDLKDLTERNLQLAIETCLDIGKIVPIHKLGKLSGLRNCVLDDDAQPCEERAFPASLSMILNLFCLNWTY